MARSLPAACSSRSGSNCDPASHRPSGGQRGCGLVPAPAPEPWSRRPTACNRPGRVERRTSQCNVDGSQRRYRRTQARAAPTTQPRGLCDRDQGCRVVRDQPRLQLLQEQRAVNPRLPMGATHAPVPRVHGPRRRRIPCLVRAQLRAWTDPQRPSSSNASAAARPRINGRRTTRRPASSMTSNLSLAARVISEGFLPARSALLQGPREPVSGPVSPNRIRGMLLGLAIGDALGNTSESLPVLEREARYGEIRDYLPNSRSAGRRVGLPSDDSQLAFWTLESLLECGGLDPDDLSARFASREIFGLGKSMQQFLRNRAQGAASWYHYGAESAGNGALMRIAPARAAAPAGHECGPLAGCGAGLDHHASRREFGCVVRGVRRPARAPVAIARTADVRTGSSPRSCATVRQVCTDQPYRARSGRFTGREGSFPDYLEFVLDQARRHDWSTREPAQRGRPAPTCWRRCRACCGSSPVTRTTRRKRSCAPSTTRTTTIRSPPSSVRPSARCTARTHCPPLATRTARQNDDARQRPRVPPDRGSGPPTLALKGWQLETSSQISGVG